MTVIQDGNAVVLQRHNYLRIHTINTKGGQKVPTVQLGKELTIDLTNAIGNEFGSAFKMIKKEKIWILEPAEEVIDFEQLFLDEDQQSGRDNRDLKDENQSQKLSRDEIENMKEQGVIGSEMVGQLIKNSETFQQKTKFSQAKFLKKKAKKYSEFLIIRKPSIRLLMEISYKKDPVGMMNLRIDSLAQLLNNVSVRSGGNYLVYETGCHSLIVAATLERTGGQGKVIHVYQTGNPQTQSISSMNFDKTMKANLSTINMSHLRSMEQGHDIAVMHQANNENGSDKGITPHRQAQRESSMASYKIMTENGVDGLIIASKQHPTNILLNLLKYLKPSRSFAVFSPYQEPLLDAYLKVKATGKAVMVTLSESWLRNHQVLPGRTHPEVLMSGGGGYILTGIAVDSSEFDSEPRPEEDVSATGGRKKNKRFRRR